MNEKQLQQAFIQFLAQKSGAKTQQELDKYIQSIGEKGMEKAKQEFIELVKQQQQKQQQEQQKQAQKVAHGTKLQYFRKLKNQCPEGEELVYYKRGGTVDCGCIKKGEAGTNLQPQDSESKNKESVVDKFKRKAREIKNKVTGKSAKQYDKPKTNQYGEYTDKYGNMIITEEGMNARQKELDSNKMKGDEDKKPPVINKGVGKNAYGSKMTPIKKNKCGSKVMQDKCGSKIKKKACGAKVEKEKCGNKVVAKFKNRKK